MNRAVTISALSVSALAIAAILSGCAPAKPQGKPSESKVFKQVTLPANVAPTAVPIDETVQQQAANQILLAFNSSDPVIKAQSLEAMSRTHDVNAVDRVQRALTDKNWIVRFSGAMCAGDLKLKGTYKALVAVAYDDDANVRLAVRYALHQLGDKSLSKDLEALSTHMDPKVRANTAFALGLLGEPTATRVLKPMITDADIVVRMQAAEALWRLGDEQGEKNLVAASLSKYVDDQLPSLLALAAPRDQRVKPYIMAKFANDHDNKQFVELQLVAARALGMLGDDAGFGLCVKNCTATDPRRRALAALALGDIGRPDAQDALAKLLADPTQEVRLSAATALRLIGNRNRA